MNTKIWELGYMHEYHIVDTKAKPCLKLRDAASVKLSTVQLG